MSENESVVEIKPDVARSKTRAFFARHKTKIVVTSLSASAAALFIAGRRSKDVVDSVDVDVNRPDDTTQD